MNGIAGMLLTLQIQAEQRRRNEEETEEQLREQEEQEEQEDLKRRRQNKEHKEKQEAKELFVLQNGEEVPAHQILDTDAVVITQDPQGNFVRSYGTFEKH